MKHTSSNRKPSKMIDIKNIFGFYIITFFVITLLSLPLLLSFFRSGYFPTHDGEWAVVRLADMYRTIRDFQIPARYSGYLNFGYGYPLFNFAYPMPYYLGTLLVLAGFGFVASIKSLFVIATILSGYFMFLASRHIWKNTWAGIASAVLYFYFPYRLVDLYVRGSIGEIVAFTFFPLILLSISKLSEGSKSSFYIILLAVSTALLITSHNIMSVLFLIVIAVFTLTLTFYREKRTILYAGLGFVVGFGLSAFFSLPALFEKKYILLSEVPIADRNLYFVRPYQLLISNFGYGNPTDYNSFTYQIGLPHILSILIVGFMIVFAIRNKQVTLYTRIAISLLLLCIFFIFMMFSISSILWSLPLLSEINYPWTMLSQVGFCTALLGGFLVTKAKYIGLILSLLAGAFYLPYAHPVEFVDRGDNFYVTNDATTTSSTELLPLWVEERPSKRVEQKIKFEHDASVSDLVIKSNNIGFQVMNVSDNKMYINTIYYPGWKLTIDGVENTIDYNNPKGLISSTIPAGKHVVNVSFTETPFRFFANMISLFSVIMCVFLIVFGKKSKILNS